MKIQDRFYKIYKNASPNMGEVFFLMAYVCWLVYSLINITTWDTYAVLVPLKNGIYYLSFVLLFIQFLIKGEKGYCYKDYIAILIICYLGLVVYHHQHDRYVLYAFIFAYAAAEVDFNKIIKATLAIQMPFMLLTIVASLSGIVENIIFSDWTGERIRYSLGYGYCAYAAHLFIFLTAGYLCFRNKTKWYEYVIILAIATVLHRLTDSRSDYIQIYCLIMGDIVINRMQIHSRIAKLFEWCMQYCVIFYFAISIAIQWLYSPDKEWMVKLDGWLNSRLRLGRDAIEDYGFSLFGNNIKWVGVGGEMKNPTLIYNYVDNAYLKDILSFGLVFEVGFLVLVILTMRSILKSKNYKFAWAICMALFYGLINAHMNMLQYDMFILLLGRCFKNDTDEEISIENKRISKCISGLSIGMGIGLCLFHFMAQQQVRELNTISSAEYGFYRWVGITLVVLIMIVGCLFSTADITRGILSRIKIELTAGRMMCILFLGLIWLSDVMVAKRYTYVGCTLIILCGFIIVCRNKMNCGTKERLRNGITLGYLLGYILCSVYCMAKNPILENIPFAGGIDSDAEWSILALIAMFCISYQLLYRDKIGYLECSLLSVGGVVGLVALFLGGELWGILVGIVILTIGISYRWYITSKYPSENRSLPICKTGCIILGVVVSFAVVYVLGRKNGLLASLASEIKLLVNPRALMHKETNQIRQWLMLQRTYLGKRNLWGHKNFIKIHKEYTRPAGLLMMVVYQYGVLSGMLLSVCLFRMFVRDLKRICKKEGCRVIQSFMVWTITIFILFFSAEIPLVGVGWYWVICYLVVYLE